MVAGIIKNQLAAAEFAGIPIPRFLADLETGSCKLLIDEATHLASGTSVATATAVVARVEARFGRLAGVSTELARLERETA